MRRSGSGVPHAVGQDWGEARRAHQGIPVVPGRGPHAPAPDAHPAAHHEHDDQRARLARHPLVRAHRHARHDILHEHHYPRHRTRYSTSSTTAILNLFCEFNFQHIFERIFEISIVWTLSICTLSLQWCSTCPERLFLYTFRPPICFYFAYAGIVLVLTIHPGNPSQTLKQYGSTTKAAGAIDTTMDLIRCALATSVCSGARATFWPIILLN